jgi:transposase
MQASTVDTPTAAHCDTIFVAIELSQRSWLVTLHCPDRDRISRHGLESGDHGGLLALIDRVRERVARALGQAPAVVSRYEAGYDGFWLHRLLRCNRFNERVSVAASAVVSAGWMITVPPLGQQTGRFVDGSHPHGFLAASMRNLGTAKAVRPDMR